MNSFNSDQKPAILNGPETPEGGASGTRSQVPTDELVEEALALKQVEESLEGEAIAEGGETIDKANPELYIENLSSLISEAAEAVQQEKEKASFEIDPDTGLSLQGVRIEELKAKLEAIQNGEISEIDNPILAERSKEKEILLANLENLNNIKIAIDKKIQDRGESLEDLLKVSPELAQKLELLQSQLTEAEKTLAQYEEETKIQLLEAGKLAESQLQSELESTQKAYVGSEEELSDKKILLEMGLQDDLTNPDQLFSEQNIQQVLDTYGLQEGLERLQQLRTESNEAREQAAKAEIQTDIINYAYDYQNNLDLAKALDQDIEAKLQTLQQQNPDSETISRALDFRGKDRLAYLTNSKDPELQELAFWFSEGRGDKIEAQILAEHPNFAKYVEQQTENRYAKQQQDIKDGRLGGRTYLGSQADIQLQQEIDGRIEVQFNRVKADRLQALKTELISLQSDEYGSPFDSLDQSISSDRENFNPAEIDKFQAKLAQALEDGRVKFEKGIFSSAEDIPAKNKQINQELSKLLETTKPILEISGYAIQSLDDLSGIEVEINQNKEKAEKRPLGFGKNTAKALEKLAQEVSKAMAQYNQLQADKQSNIDKFQADSELTNQLQQDYDKLPKFIQDKLFTLENPSLDTITKTLESGLDEIQNYQTPPEIVEKRQKITDLESQIAETQSITAPTASTQPST